MTSLPPACCIASVLCLIVMPPLRTAATGTPPPPSGPQLFDDDCGVCHSQIGTGTIMLSRRLGEDKALLAERTDLDPGYVRHVVRNGIGSMPPLTQVDVSDAELERIIAYLTRHRPSPQQGGRRSLQDRHE